MNRYAYLCTYCDHLAAAHRLLPGGDLQEGPYRCRTGGCTCERNQKGADVWISYAAYLRLPLEVREAANMLPVRAALTGTGNQSTEETP